MPLCLCRCLLAVLRVPQGTYEETRVQTAQLGDKVKFLKEGMECNVLSWNDKASSALPRQHGE